MDTGNWDENPPKKKNFSIRASIKLAELHKLKIVIEKEDRENT